MTAENGQVAIDIIKENEIDLVLMDVQMPVMDGIEATKCKSNALAPTMISENSLTLLVNFYFRNRHSPTIEKKQTQPSGDWSYCQFSTRGPQILPEYWYEYMLGETCALGDIEKISRIGSVPVCFGPILG